MNKRQLIEKVLNERQIKEAIQSNRTFEDQIKRAAAYLVEHEDADEDDLLPALMKAIDAITGTVRVFISYKSEEAHIAKRLNDVLVDFSNRRVSEVFFAGYSLTGGEDWRRKLRRAVTSAHWFILILPSLQHERDWVIFEAGAFNTSKLPGDRLICIRHPSVPAARQIDEYHEVKGTAEGLEAFLKSRLCQPNAVPGLPSIMEHTPVVAKSLAESAREMAKLLDEAQSEWQPLMNFMELELGPEQNESTPNLRNALVTASTAHERIFGRIRPGNRLSKLSDLMELAGDDGWVEELASGVRAVNTGGRPKPVTSVLRSQDDATDFRPHLSSAHFRLNKVDKVRVIFTESMSGRLEGAPLPLQAFHASVRLTFRVRWEILQRFRPPFRQPELEGIKRSLNRIETEAHYHGLRTESMLVDAFPPEAEEEVRMIYERWRELENEEQTGKLDRAFATSDFRLLEGAMETFSKLNLEYIHLATKHAAAIIDRFWR